MAWPMSRPASIHNQVREVPQQGDSPNQNVIGNVTYCSHPAGSVLVSRVNMRWRLLIGTQGPRSDVGYVSLGCIINTGEVRIVDARLAGP